MALRRTAEGSYVPSRSCCRISGQRCRNDSKNWSIVSPSGPGAPRLRLTFFQAASTLASSTISQWSHSRLAARHAPLRSIPVGTVNLWSRYRRRLEIADRLAPRGSLAVSVPVAPPCTSLFGPSRLDWTSRLGTMTSAEFCTARGGFHQRVPMFRASPTGRSDAWPRPDYADFPG